MHWSVWRQFIVMSKKLCCCELFCCTLYVVVMVHTMLILLHSVCSCDGSHDVDAAPTRMYRKGIGEVVGELSTKLSSLPHVSVVWPFNRLTAGTQYTALQIHFGRLPTPSVLLTLSLAASWSPGPRKLVSLAITRFPLSGKSGNVREFCLNWTVGEFCCLSGFSYAFANETLMICICNWQ